MPAWLAGRRGRVRPDSRNVLRGQATRRRILDAARARIVAEGFEALRLDDLARDAGVTKAAVVKSVGGKSSILLTLAEEDRQTRLDVIDGARGARSSLERRLGHVVRRLLELDAGRARLFMAFVGHLWFWSGDERARAQSMIDDTRAHLRELIAEASAGTLSAERCSLVAERLTVGYAVGIGDLHHGVVDLAAAVRQVVKFALH